MKMGTPFQEYCDRAEVLFRTGVFDEVSPGDFDEELEELEELWESLSTKEREEAEPHISELREMRS